MYGLTFFSLLPGAFLFHILSISNVAVVRSTAVNRSIDDTLGDSVTGQKPVFLPSTPGVWANNTQCGGCGLQPPTSSAFDGTYTAATYNPGLENISITFDFTGTAVFIFFILANNPLETISASTTTAANFSVDGFLEGTFSHWPNGSTPDFLFNYLAFSMAGMKDEMHQMIISTSGLSENVWVNFDYALYTYEEEAETNPSASESSTIFTYSSSIPSSSTSSEAGVGTSFSSSHSGAIAGGAVAGLVALCALISTVFFCRRRQRRMHQLGDGDHETSVNPYIIAAKQRSTLVPMSKYQNSSSGLPVSTHGNPPGGLTVPTTALSGNRADFAETSQSQNRYNKISPGTPNVTSSIPANNLEYQNQSAIPIFPSPSSPSVGLTPRRSITNIRAPDDEVDMAQMQEQIRAMSDQIAFLQSHQRSSWAQGLSDEPPPLYDDHADTRA